MEAIATWDFDGLRAAERALTASVRHEGETRKSLLKAGLRYLLKGIGREAEPGEHASRPARRHESGGT